MQAQYHLKCVHWLAVYVRSNVFIIVRSYAIRSFFIALEQGHSAAHIVHLQLFVPV